MAAYNVTPADCFGTTAAYSAPQTTSSTRRFFTVDENMGTLSPNNVDHLYHNINNPLGSSHSILRTSSYEYSIAAATKMPTWLRLQEAHLMQENMNGLREAMLNSFFTQTEVLKLTYAIQEAANGDRAKQAGAAEFCLIMVETMEMGLNALIAAAFHYCSCVVARERSLFPKDDLLSDILPWELRHHHGMDSFGDHAVQIEQDAARLKRLEVVAFMVVHKSNNSHRVTPDSHGADNLRNLFLTEAKDWRALAIRGAACLYQAMVWTSLLMQLVALGGTSQDEALVLVFFSI
jgi:hypothetical protein